MTVCRYFREEPPEDRKYIGLLGLEVNLLPNCSKPGLVELGVPEDIIHCDGDFQNCPLKEIKDQTNMWSEANK